MSRFSAWRWLGGVSLSFARICLALSCLLAFHVNARGGAANGAELVPVSCTAQEEPAKDPYRWYPTLDLARIPFHNADGPWGARSPIVAPAPPVTKRTVYVTSAKQMAAESLVPGTRIVVDADYIGPTVLFGDVADVDIVVPRGRTIARLAVGRYSPTSTTRRVRIRGTTPGEHSGGLIGHIAFYSNPATDIIVDGVDLNGEDGEGGGLLLLLSWPAERVAVVNVRGHGVGPATLGGGNDIVFAGNHIMSGARPREVNGYPEGWGIRGGNRIVVYDNRIEGTRYHRVRVHPDRSGPPPVAWIAGNTFVDPHEARIFGAFPTENSKRRFASVWAICNRVYAHSVCFGPSFEAPNTDYAVLTSNSFFGSFTEAMQRRLQRVHGPGRDYLGGNTFEPWREPPPWNKPGDPKSAVPLPPVKTERYNASLTFEPCPPP